MVAGLAMAVIKSIIVLDSEMMVFFALSKIIPAEMAWMFELKILTKIEVVVT